MTTEDGRYATLSGYDIDFVPYMPGRNNSNTLDIPDEWDADHSPISRVPCIHGLARYDFKLVKVNGVWKHYSAEHESLCTFPNLYLAGKESRGWSDAVSDVKYPLLWEKYSYVDQRKNGKSSDSGKRSM